MLTPWAPAGTRVRLSEEGCEAWPSLGVDAIGVVLESSATMARIHWEGEEASRLHYRHFLDVAPAPAPEPEPPSQRGRYRPRRKSVRRYNTRPPGQGWVPARYRGDRPLREVIREHLAEINGRRRR